MFEIVAFKDNIYRYIYDSSDPDVLTAVDNLDDVGEWNPPSVLESMQKQVQQVVPSLFCEQLVVVSLLRHIPRYTLW